PRPRVRQGHHPRAAGVQQPVHPRPGRRLPRHGADLRHHARQPRLRRGHVPAPGVRGRHPARGDHDPGQAREQEPHRQRDRVVRAPRLQPARPADPGLQAGRPHGQAARERRQQPGGGERMTTDLRHWVPTARDLTIGRRAVPGAGPQNEAVNPATEEVTATVATAGLAQVDEAVAAARRAFPAWAAASPAERSAALHRLADLMERNSERLAAAIVNEVGTPIAFAEIMQVQLGIAHLRWQAEAALVDRTVDLGEWHDPVPTRSVVAYRPAGVVACITGYNYPLNLAIFKFGAALAAGCTAVLLPSPRTPLTTLWLGELF